MTIADSDDESDSPLTAQSLAPLAAWETVDEDDIEKDQADHKFDLSILFNFASRGRIGSGSGIDDAENICNRNIPAYPNHWNFYRPKFPA